MLRTVPRSPCGRAEAAKYRANSDYCLTKYKHQGSRAATGKHDSLSQETRIGRIMNGTPRVYRRRWMAKTM